MSNCELGTRNPNQDPHLGQDDKVQNTNDNSENQWEEAMRGMPSYSEHRDHMQEEEEMSM